MSNMLEVAGAVLLVVLTLLVRWLSRPAGKLPPGPIGLPFVGQTMSFLRAHSSDNAEQWVRGLAAKYGPIVTVHVFGMPTVFFSGQAANKFIYTNADSLLVPYQPPWIHLLTGKRNLLMLHGEDHRRVREAIVCLLKPDALKNNLGKIAQEVKDHFIANWSGRDSVLAIPLFKNLTFSIMCSLIVGIDMQKERDEFVELLDEVVEGLLSIPINLPFSRFGLAISANKKMRSMLTRMVEQKRAVSTDNHAPPRDLLTGLIRMKKGEDNDEPYLTTDDILDNVVMMLIAGYDSTAGLLTVLVKYLTDKPSVYSRVEQEQEEIARQREGGLLSWEDIGKMKYSWKVVMECLRLKPPFFGSFRRVAKDFEYEGYLIPAGWQVVWTKCMTHMDETLFTEPLQFEPDRFAQRQPPFSFIPFGGGNRLCPGHEFAKLETLFALHYLATNFKWSLCNPSIPLSRVVVPTREDGLKISLEKKSLFAV